MAGDGDLPLLVSNEALKNNFEVWICTFNKISKNLSKEIKIIHFHPYDLESLFDALAKKGIEDIMFAGKITRGSISNLPSKTKKNIFFEEVLPVLWQKDDFLLRKIGSIFEKRGFKILQIQNMFPDLVIGEELLTVKAPSKQNMEDYFQAKEYHQILSKTDIGQALVVGSGLCFAIETLPGTDAMLDFVCQQQKCSNASFLKAGLVLYKAPKINQDRRFDLPVIGEETLMKVKEANIQGVFLKKGEVLIINKENTITAADELGLFILGL